MFFKKRKLYKIGDRLFSTALMCSADLNKILKPKSNKMILFEIIVYIVFRLDLAMVKNHLNDMYRTELLKIIGHKIGDYFYDLVKDVEIHEAINGRMNQYARIMRTSSSQNILEGLHELLTQLLFHAAQSECLFNWRKGSDPLHLTGITEDIALKILLGDIEVNNIIPLEVDCNKIFNAMPKEQ